MMPTAPPRAAAPVAGTVVSASVEAVRWRAETTSVNPSAPTNGTNGTSTQGTNGTHANGTADAAASAAAPEAAPETPTTEAPVAGEPVADAPSLLPGEIDIEFEMPPKKKRWFRRDK